MIPLELGDPCARLAARGDEFPMKRFRLVDLPLIIKIGFAPAFALLMLALMAGGAIRRHPCPQLRPRRRLLLPSLV